MTSTTIIKVWKQIGYKPKWAQANENKKEEVWNVKELQKVLLTNVVHVTPTFYAN